MREENKINKCKMKDYLEDALSNLKAQDVERKYFLYLSKKYCVSRGRKFNKLEFDVPDFVRWLKEYIDLTKNYADFLSSYDIELDDYASAEVGKGKFDSIIGTDGVEISEFAETMERPRMVVGNVDKGLIICKDRKILTLDDLNIDKIITQNPNSFDEVKGLTSLANNLEKNITFGVYGNLDDEDKLNKIKMVENIIVNTDNIRFEYDTFGDSFYMMATTKPYIKCKVKTLGR